jgi:hypothetical protein
MIKEFFLRIRKRLDCKRKKLKVQPATGDPDTEAGGNCIAELKVVNEDELLGLEAMFALKKRIVSKNPLPIAKVYNIGKVIGQGNLGDVRYC